MIARLIDWLFHSPPQIMGRNQAVKAMLALAERNKCERKH